MTDLESRALRAEAERDAAYHIIGILADAAGHFDCKEVDWHVVLTFARATLTPQSDRSGDGKGRNNKKGP